MLGLGRGRLAAAPDADAARDPRSRRTAGFAWEDRAAAYLEAMGFRIVTRGYRARRGEIDIVARDGCEIVFIEVRARRSRDYGGAGCSIGPRKKARVVSAAKEFLQRHRLTQAPCRFDVVLIFTGTEPPEFEHIRDAFQEG